MIAIDRFLDEFDRNLAIQDIPDIAVVQRIEMRDIEQILDQQSIVRIDFPIAARL